MKHSKITGKTVLVTGGVGSIGSELVKKVLEYQPRQVRVIDNNELRLFEAMQQYHEQKQIRFLLGDIRDRNRVMWAMQNVDIVFHTAALKHVALNEYSPFESVKTNVLGTQNLLEAALNHNAETFINISTDKAANPTSTMGASKLLAERLTVGADYYKGKAKTNFANVRFGNVLNSSGSVIPIFLKQIKSGQPVTVTDKNMIRYFMTIPDAVTLILQAAAIAQGGEIFILKMPALKVIDLAQVMINELSDKKLTIKIVGKKPGEKLYEKIVTRTEASQALELKDMYVLPLTIDYPTHSEDIVKKSYDYYLSLGGKAVPEEGVQPQQLLTPSEIRALLIRAGILK
jgi:FlaA1/EpsC-like NDP-sugar epimerase